jgi:hypothetical protein
LINLQGKIVKQKDLIINNGTSNLTIDNTDNLPSAAYILRIEFNGRVLQRKVVKVYSH